MSYPFSTIDHVQLAMPEGEEETARIFYARMTELPKPLQLAKRGGCWFTSGNVQLHLGVEADFRPAKKAHPALICRDYEALLQHLREAGIAINEPDDIPAVKRCHLYDPFGNRLELISS
jgi:catechol 2,3-dioxygenase-like lactoylglutathione lyase family enzyme